MRIEIAILFWAVSAVGITVVLILRHMVTAKEMKEVVRRAVFEAMEDAAARKAYCERVQEAREATEREQAKLIEQGFAFDEITKITKARRAKGAPKP